MKEDAEEIRAISNIVDMSLAAIAEAEYLFNTLGIRSLPSANVTKYDRRFV